MLGDGQCNAFMWFREPLVHQLSSNKQGLDLRKELDRRTGYGDDPTAPGSGRIKDQAVVESYPYPGDSMPRY